MLFVFIGLFGVLFFLLEMRLLRVRLVRFWLVCFLYGSVDCLVGWFGFPGGFCLPLVLVWYLFGLRWVVVALDVVLGVIVC